MSILKMKSHELVEQIEMRVEDLRRYAHAAGSMAGKKTQLEDYDRAISRAAQSRRAVLDMVHCLRLHAIDRLDPIDQ